MQSWNLEVRGKVRGKRKRKTDNHFYMQVHARLGDTAVGRRQMGIGRLGFKASLE